MRENSPIIIIEEAENVIKDLEEPLTPSFIRQRRMEKVAKKRHVAGLYKVRDQIKVNGEKLGKGRPTKEV